jgi:Protein of unknown function (DUF2752)
MAMMLQRSAKIQRLIVLAIVLVPVVGSYMLHLGVDIVWLSCPLRRWLGVPCPAWGLTRSFIATARGDWHQAIGFHLFGPFLFGGFFMAGLHLLLEVLRGRPFNPFYVVLVRHPKVQLGGFALLFSYHGWRLYLMARTGELYPALVHSPIGQMFF